jgi:HemK-like putative methylase
MTGIDISPQAIDLARDNAERCKLAHRVDFRMANVMTAVSGRYDVITSNPPYITTAEYDTLPTSVKDYEDPRALLGSLGEVDDGLTFYRRIAHMLPDLLNPGPADWPCVMLEIGAGQGEAVKDIMKTVPCLDRAEIWDDAYGKPRAVVAWRRA